MTTPASNTYLRRYTDLPALLYLLTQKKLTLLDPQSWDDSNDSHYLAEYQRKNNLATILALCFSKAPETYHHWKVFSGNSTGVCIRFKRTLLLRALQGKGLTMGDVKYLTLGEAKKSSPKIAELPFIKRAAFVDEDEYRIVYESQKGVFPKLDIDIPLACVNRITLSPWLHKSLVETIKTTICQIPGCGKMEVVRSTLISNETWKTLGANAA